MVAWQLMTVKPQPLYICVLTLNTRRMTREKPDPVQGYMLDRSTHQSTDWHYSSLTESDASSYSSLTESLHEQNGSRTQGWRVLG